MHTLNIVKPKRFEHFSSGYKWNPNLFINVRPSYQREQSLREIFILSLIRGGVDDDGAGGGGSGRIG